MLGQRYRKKQKKNIMGGGGGSTAPCPPPPPTPWRRHWLYLHMHLLQIMQCVCKECRTSLQPRSKMCRTHLLNMRRTNNGVPLFELVSTSLLHTNHAIWEVIFCACFIVSISFNHARSIQARRLLHTPIHNYKSTDTTSSCHMSYKMRHLANLWRSFILFNRCAINCRTEGRCRQ